MAEKFGGKYSLGLGILSTAIFTLLTPAVVFISKGDWRWLVGLRVLEGLGEGTTYPALNVLLAKWVPLQERAKIGSLVYAGGQMGRNISPPFDKPSVTLCSAGTVVSNTVSGFLIAATNDWAAVFYVFGTLGILWFVLWTLLCYSSPESHPFISDKEKIFLEKEMGNINEQAYDPLA